MIHLCLFGVLAATLVSVYVYRHWLENHEDHYIHLHNDSHDDSVITSQTSVGRRMEMVEKIKNGLMAATVAYALAIAAMGIYWAWTSSSTVN